MDFIVLFLKSDVCMAKNGKDTKHTRQISRRMYFVKNDEYFIHNTVWCEGGIKLADIVTKNVRGDEFIPRLVYAMVRLDNWPTICTREVIGYKIV